MDIATIIGLVVGILVVLKTAGSAAGLYAGPALLLVVVGGIAATLVSCPLRDTLNVFAVVKNVFFTRSISPQLLIERVVGFATTARREGILALETAVGKDDDAFLAQGVRLAVDGTEPDLIMDILETELQFIEERHKRSQNLLERLGRYWALFGGVGALLVLVQGSGGTGTPLVGQAALPLLYGALLFGLVGAPFARKLQGHSESEILVKRMTIEGIMSIQSGDNPRIVEHKLSVYIQPKYRPSGEKPMPTAPPASAEDRTRTEVEKFIAEKRNPILSLVREQARTAPAEQKNRLEEAVGKVERGEMSLVALLARLDGRVRSDLLHKMEEPSLPITEAPSQGFSFEDIGKLKGRDLQRLLREVDQKDLIVALSGASDELREKVFGNISQRVLIFMQEEMSYQHFRPEQVLEMQARIVAQVFELWDEIGLN